MKELKVFVERCVRPIRAEESVKLDMRKELYSHLLAAYEQERERAKSHEAAVQAAMARMGDSDELSVELKGTLSFFDHLVGNIDDYARFKINETPWQYAIRLTKLSFLCISLFLILFIGMVILLEGQFQFEQLLLVRCAFAVIFVHSIIGFAFGWVFGNLRDQFENHGWHSGLLRSLLRVCFKSLLFTVVVGSLFFVALSGDIQATITYMPRWIPLGLLVGPGVLWTAYVDAKLTRALREWQELQIKE